MFHSINRESIKNEIKVFLSRFIGDVDLDDDENLFSSGLLNSLFAMQLVMFIEKTYNFKVAKDDLDSKNFCSVTAVTNFIEYKNLNNN